MPAEITAGYWKAIFEPYTERVLRLSRPALAEYLFSTRDWRSEAFVSRARAEAILRSGGSHRIERLVGVEAWLRTRGRNVDG